MFSLARETQNLCGLVLFGGTYGAALDYAHTHGGAIDYPPGTCHERGVLTFAFVYSIPPLLNSWFRTQTEDFIELSPVPDAGGGASVGRDAKDGTTHFTPTEQLRRRFIRAVPLAPLREAVPAFLGLYTSAYLVTAYAWAKLPNWGIAAMIAAPTLALYHRWDRTPQGLLAMAVTGAFGTSVEAFLNSVVGSMTYSVDHHGGVPHWLFWLYAMGSVLFGQVTRRLLEPGHDTDIFVGVGSLPSGAARRYYANHRGMRPTSDGHVPVRDD